MSIRKRVARYNESRINTELSMHVVRSSVLTAFEAKCRSNVLGDERKAMNEVYEYYWFSSGTRPPGNAEDTHGYTVRRDATTYVARYEGISRAGDSRLSA